MNPLEQDIRETARNLQGLYRELHAHKWTRQVREVRTMKVAPGPQAPTPGWITSLDDELTRALQPLVAECAGHIDRRTTIWPHGATMCEWVALKANYIADLGVADALLEEMQDQVAVITKRLSNLPGAEAKIGRGKAIALALGSDKWGTADELAPLVGNITGSKIDRTRITSIGRNPKFETRTNHRGHKQYSLAQLIQHFLSN